MNHLLKVFLVLCLSALAVVVVLLTARSEGSDLRQQAVESYVAFKQTTLAQPVSVGQYVWASMPQNFRPEMSRDSFGNAIYYQPSQRYIWPTQPAQTRQPSAFFSITETTPGALGPYSMTTSAYMSGRPLPYPPTDLWCVQLISPDPAAPQVVLAALHQDIYNAEWIVHEVIDPKTILAAVGCQFSAQ